MITSPTIYGILRKLFSDGRWYSKEQMILALEVSLPREQILRKAERECGAERVRKMDASAQNRAGCAQFICQAGYRLWHAGELERKRGKDGQFWYRRNRSSKEFTRRLKSCS